MESTDTHVNRTLCDWNFGIAEQQDNKIDAEFRIKLFVFQSLNVPKPIAIIFYS